MRLFHTTNYKIYNKNLLKDLKTVIISDLHFSKLVTDKKLDLITSKIKKINPDYILIPGDIINSLDEIDDTFEYNRLLSWINNLGTTILSIGGHDFYKKNNSNWKYQDPDKLIVNGPLTMFHGKLLKFFNSFYPYYITIIDFTSDSKYKDKLRIKRTYNK